VPAPVVRAETIRFRHRCPDPSLLALGLDCDPAVPGGRLFDRQGDTWALDLPRPAPSTLHRIEYRLRHQGVAEDLLLSGRSVGAEEARAIGLVHTIADDPSAAATAWFDRHLADKSAAGVRFAIAAARLARVDEVRRGLARVERLYLEGLMNTRDANEGLAAFLARRPPVWEHH
jgi:cyclohexa-1,5-dienecarbonyl-CoA hydratase